MSVTESELASRSESGQNLSFGNKARLYSSLFAATVVAGVAAAGCGGESEPSGNSTVLPSGGNTPELDGAYGEPADSGEARLYEDNPDVGLGGDGVYRISAYGDCNGYAVEPEALREDFDLIGGDTGLNGVPNDRIIECIEEIIGQKMEGF